MANPADRIRAQLEKHNAALKVIREKRDAEVVRRRAAGESVRVLAREYDLSDERVRRIVARANRNGNGEAEPEFDPFREVKRARAGESDE